MANIITVGRVLLLFVAVGLLYTDRFWPIFIAAWLIALVFLGDGIDGWVARRRGSTTNFGAVLDIAGDRIVENVLWIVMADLGIVPIWAPLVVLTRSFAVDVVRAAVLPKGKTPFGDSTMARSPLTKWLTASRFSRAYYGWSKGFAFFFLTLMLAWQAPGGATSFLDPIYSVEAFRFVVWFLTYSSVALCVIRGLPVLYDAYFYLRDEDAEVPDLEPMLPQERPWPPISTEQPERGRQIS
jgi:CDP-diacylglycerol--glycerol-3-phosphate 3-phosphatidyltransferase